MNSASPGPFSEKKRAIRKHIQESDKRYDLLGRLESTNLIRVIRKLAQHRVVVY